MRFPRSFRPHRICPVLILLLTLAPSLLPPARAADPSSDGAALCSRGRIDALTTQLQRETSTEPTANQKAYDARYYRLDLTIDPSVRRITGQATVRGTVIEGPLRRIELDLDDALGVTGVIRPEEGDTLTFTHVNRLLTVELPGSLDSGADFSFVVSYRGSPLGDSFHFDTQAGKPMIWTLSAPYGARSWWPCKDYPEDKADSVDIVVRSPTGMLAASNGTLRADIDDGATATRWWHEAHPIATYLVSLAIHPYRYYSDWYHPSSQPDSMPIVFYNFAASQENARPVQAKVKQMIAYFASRFGEYPFLDEKYGHAEFLWNGGMENQTITSLGTYTESVVAHELSHMWWGDFVTCRDYHDIWLNEGFATYCEALWAEAVGGPGQYHAKMAETKYVGSGSVYAPDTFDPNRIYDKNLSYYKGSWVLHMLRHLVGDDDFFGILREYRTRHAGGTASTADFRAVAEEISGQDLGPFFQEWVYGERAPVYQYQWSAAPAGGTWDLSVRVQQLQDGQIFTMPIDLVITTAGSVVRNVVENSGADQTFRISVQGQPTKVELDPDEWILRQVLGPLPSPTFDRPLLLVNGVTWSGTTSAEMRRTYDAQPFTGDSDYDFWDCFPAPADGYPLALPSPKGHGAVPAEVLGRYQAVVWIGNNLGGDTEAWQSTPMYSYLEAGGNALVLTRTANILLTAPYRNYLGVQWAGTDSVYDCVPATDGFTRIRPTGLQSSVTWFDPESVGPETTVLFKASAGHHPDWGIAAIREPGLGGRTTGGRFALLGGRPYRWNTADLKANIRTLLARFMPQRVDPSLSLALSAEPNPASGRTLIRFFLPSEQWADLGDLERDRTEGPHPACGELACRVER